MFSITSKERRVTKYVKVQAYKWLYEKIVKGEYTAHTIEAEEVILGIRRDGFVTENTYKQFFQLFLNMPYDYILTNDKLEESGYGITTNMLPNYFVRYNGTNLPLGFIKDFFEDDYETKADIEEYYKAYLDGALDELIINCRSTKNICLSNVTETTTANPGVFQPKISFHVTNIIKSVLTLAALVLNLMYLIGNDVVNEIIDFFDKGTNTFVEEELGIIVANLFLLLFLIPKVVKIITTIVFYIRLSIVRGYVKKVVKSMDVFGTDTVENFKEHFSQINDELKQTRIIEGDCLKAPKGKKQYLTIANFKIDVINGKLDKLNKKFNDDLYYNYNKTIGNTTYTLDKCKKQWKRGIVFTTIFIVIFVFLNVPGPHDWLFDILSSAGII